MKLIIEFKTGQYSPVKDEFKGLFSKVFKWDGYKAWKGKTGRVEATEKMEPGTSHIFHVECDENIGKKLTDFCNNENHKIKCDEVQTFIPSGMPQLLPVEIEISKPLLVKEEKEVAPEFPWICPEYNYDLWKYRKEQLLNEWNPEHKIIWS